MTLIDQSPCILPKPLKEIATIHVYSDVHVYSFSPSYPTYMFIQTTRLFGRGEQLSFCFVVIFNFVVIISLCNYFFTLQLSFSFVVIFYFVVIILLCSYHFTLQLLFYFVVICFFVVFLYFVGLTLLAVMEFFNSCLLLLKI